MEAKIYKLQIREVSRFFSYLEFYGPVNTVEVMSSQSVNLFLIFLGRIYIVLPVFVCIKVLWPSQPKRVMLSAVTIPNHTLPVTNNCPSLISGKQRMTTEIISWSITMKITVITLSIGIDRPLQTVYTQIRKAFANNAEHGVWSGSKLFAINTAIF